MNDNTLGIAFKGQLYKTDASSANYVFPQGTSDWASISESDPRTALTQLNINGNFPFYSIFITESSVIYAFRRTLSGRANSNCVMVMLRAGGPTNAGSQLVELLQELLKYAVSKTSFDQVDKTVLTEKLSSCKGLIDWCKKPNAKIEEPSKIKDGYRIYKNDEELYKILENPYQPAYRGFRCIHIVPEDAGAKVDKNVNQNENDFPYLISGPIEKVYYIKLPQGVYEKDGKRHVRKNDAFTLIYKRDGYNNKESGTQYVNKDSDCFTVSGDSINVYDAETCKIEFERSITISVNDKLGNPIKEFKYQWDKLDNRDIKCNIVENKIKFSAPDGDYTIKISAEGYKTEPYQFNTCKKQDFSVSLTSKDFKKDITIKPAWPKKKIIPKGHKEKNVSLEYSANTSLYKQYKEELNPDSKIIPTFYITTKKPRTILVTLCIISVLIGSILGLGVGYLKWNKKDTSEVKEERVDSAPINEDTATADNPMPEESFLEEQDIAYLNSNNIWRLDSLKSEKYQYFLMTVVANKNINYKDVPWNEYTQIKNPQWTEIVKIIQNCVSSSDWAQFNLIKYSELKKKIENTKEIDLEKAILQKEEGSNESSVQRSKNAK